MIAEIRGVFLLPHRFRGKALSFVYSDYSGPYKAIYPAFKTMELIKLSSCLYLPKKHYSQG